MIGYHQPDLSTSVLVDSVHVMLVIGRCNRTVKGQSRKFHRVFAQCWRARQRIVFLEIFHVFAFLVH